MPDRTERQVQRTDGHGRSQPIERRAVGILGYGGMETQRSAI